MTLQPDELKKLATLAKLHTPAQLRQKAELFIKVLMIQHDCLMVDLLTDRDNHALENTGALGTAAGGTQHDGLLHVGHQRQGLGGFLCARELLLVRAL